MENKKESASQGSRSNLPTFIFNRLEFSGSLGDLGTLLPIAIAMIVLNGLNATNVMVTVGLFYILGIVGMAFTCCYWKIGKSRRWRWSYSEVFSCC